MAEDGGDATKMEEAKEQDVAASDPPLETEDTDDTATPWDPAIPFPIMNGKQLSLKRI